MTFVYDYLKELNEKNKNTLATLEEFDKEDEKIKNCYYRIVENNGLYYIVNKFGEKKNKLFNCISNRSITYIIDFLEKDCRYITNLSMLQKLDLSCWCTYVVFDYIKNIIKDYDIDLLEFRLERNLKEYLGKMVLAGGKILYTVYHCIYLIYFKHNMYLVSDRKLVLKGGLKLNHLNCKKIKISNLDVSEFNSLDSFFSMCTNVESIYLENFDTSNVKNMQYMFNQCFNLKSINVEVLNTRNVENFTCMFCNCNSLKELDLNSFDMTQATSVEGMFYNCSALEKLKIDWVGHKIQNMTNFIGNCINLTYLDVEVLGRSLVKPTVLKNFKFGCTNLKEIKGLETLMKKGEYY